MMGERGRREKRDSEWCRGKAGMERKGQRGSRVVQRGGQNGEEETGGGAEWCRREARMERKGRGGSRV